MAKLRAPKDLAEFLSAAEAARRLEDLARQIRRRPAGDLVQWSIHLRYWHPSWPTAQPDRDPIVLAVHYIAGKPE